eukprot:5634603-Prymnesium_polylepis.1
MFHVANGTRRADIERHSHRGRRDRSRVVLTLRRPQTPAWTSRGASRALSAVGEPRGGVRGAGGARAGGVRTGAHAHAAPEPSAAVRGAQLCGHALALLCAGQPPPASGSRMRRPVPLLYSAECQLARCRPRPMDWARGSR